MFKLNSLIAAMAGITAFAAVSSAQAAETFDKLKERGEFVVCSKVDYRPFGFREADGTMVGLEHDLITDVVKRLEEKLGLTLKVERIPVIAANRIQFLEGGKCDMLLATMTDNPDRRKSVDIIQPNYYSSGVNIFARKDVDIKAWDDISNKTICASQGAFWNKDLTQKYNLNLLTFAGIAETELALMDGRCLALLTDDSAAAVRLSEERWSKDYELKVDTIMDASWGVAIRKENPDFREMLEETVTDWHRTGFILDLEKKWNIKPTPFTQRMHEEYKNK